MKSHFESKEEKEEKIHRKKKKDSIWERFFHKKKERFFKCISFVVELQTIKCLKVRGD